MPARTLDLEFPLGGEDRSLAYQKQRPFTTPPSLNVRSEGTLERRVRGGSRPGLVKSFTETAAELPLADGDGNPIRLLTVMRSLNSEGRAAFADTFGDMNNWDAASWTGGIPTAADGKATGVTTGVSRGAALKSGNVPSIDDQAMFSIAALLVGTANATYEVYLNMDGTTPVNTNSLSARIVFGTTSVEVSIRQDNSEIAAMGQSHLNPPGDNWFKLAVSPGGVVEVYWRDMESPVLDATVTLSPAGDNVGFDMIATAIGASNAIDDILVEYISTGGGVPPEAVIAAAKENTGGIVKLYRENTDGTLVEVANQNADLPDEILMAVDYLGKLYIADFSDNRTQQTDGSSASVVNGVLDDSDITTPNWEGLDISTATDMVELTGGASGAGEFSGKTGGVYGIAAIHATNGLTLKKASGTPGSWTNLTTGDDLSTPEYRVLRGPKRYDSDTDTLDLWPATDIPLGCRIIEIFRERIVFGGDPENPGVWYMSRSRDPNDYNYGASATDRARAIASTSATSDSGGLPIPLSAIAAISEDYCLFSGESELYLLRGDPTVGGILGNISRQIGIGSRTAHCRTPDGYIVFLTRDGLYRFHPSSPFPESISREKLPVSLINVVQNTAFVVTLEYDVRFRGIHINGTPTTAGPTFHYWFDWENQSFWTVVLGSSNYDPFSVAYDAKGNRVILGCRDGHLRHYDAAAADDDGTAVTRHVDYGPIPLNHGRLALADSLEIVLSEFSDDVSWTFRTGDSPEEAYWAATRASGTASAGVNYRQSVRHSGQWAFLRLSSTAAVRWAVEGIKLRVLPGAAEARKI